MKRLLYFFIIISVYAFSDVTFEVGYVGNPQYALNNGRKLYDTENQKSIALLYLNNLREKAGLIKLSSNPYLATAAQNHADYMQINGIVGHYESDAYSGFTGVYPSDRAVYAGYKSRDVIENLSYGQDDVNSSIDGLFSAIYHRLGFLNVTINEIGIGVNALNYNYDMGNSELNTMCQKSYDIQGEYYYDVCADSTLEIPVLDYDNAKKDIALQNQKIILWPYSDARDIPPVFFEESPDPLPNYSVSGYPISVSFNPYYFDSPPQMTNFELYDEDGNSVQKIVVMSKDNDPNGDLSEYDFAFFPTQRLKWGSRYKAVFEYLDANGDLQNITWYFTTRSLSYPYYTIDSEQNLELNVVSGKSYAIYFVPRDGNDNLGKYSYTYDNNGMSVDTSFIDLDTIRVTLNGEIGSKASFSFDNGRSLTLTIASSDTATPVDTTADEISQSSDQTTTLTQTELNIKNANLGWSLLGALDDVDVAKLDKTTFKVIWMYQDGKWYAHASSSDIQQAILNNGIDDISILKKGEGFWLYK